MDIKKKYKRRSFLKGVVTIILIFFYLMMVDKFSEYKFIYLKNTGDNFNVKNIAK